MLSEPVGAVVAVLFSLIFHQTTHNAVWEGLVLVGGDADKVELKRNARIYYSTKALRRLAPLLETIDEAIDGSVISKQAKATDLSGHFTNE